jgi:hypothetical protein
MMTAPPAISEHGSQTHDGQRTSMRCAFMLRGYGKDFAKIQYTASASPLPRAIDRDDVPHVHPPGHAGTPLGSSESHSLKEDS